MTGFLNRYLRLLAGFHILLLYGGAAFAQPVTDIPDVPETCNEDVLDVMKAKSFLESQREIESAERLILKPDSVLQYSCFPRSAEKIWPKKAGRFSEMDPQSKDSLDKAIKGLVTTGMDKYLENNSFNDYLGGTAERYEVDKNRIENKKASSPRCSIMNIIWHEAKCTDAEYNKNTGNTEPLHFVKLFRLTKKKSDDNDKDSTLLEEDLREYPYTCENSRRQRDEKIMNVQFLQESFPDYRLTAREHSGLRKAFPEDEGKLPNLLGGSMFLGIDARRNQSWGIDNVTYEDENLDVTYFEKYTDCRKNKPIPTGLTAIFRLDSGGKTKFKDVDDYVCIAPGCTYDAMSKRCKQGNIRSLR